MASSVSAQNSPPDSPSRVPFLILGADLGTGWSFGLGALAIPGIAEECGGVLGDGSGGAWHASLLLELPIGPALSLQILPGIAASHTALATPIPGSRPLRGNGQGEIEQGRIDRALDLYRTDLTLSALLRLPVAGALHLAGGLGIARTLGSEQIEREVVIAPETGLLRNGRRDDTLHAGDEPLLAAASIVPQLHFAAAYDLPISSSSTLSPTLSLSLPLTGRTAGGNWRDLSLELGAAFRFGLTEKVIVDTVPPPVITRVPALAASIATRPPIVEVRIDEYDSLEALPLLNQIFFAEGSSRIPERYRMLDREGAAVFTRDLLVGSALDVYYHMLNLIGKRLQEMPTATIAINGYRNSRESDARLSAARADAVRRYLVDVWRIAPRRISIRGGALPPNPARENVAEGFEENARVELVSSDPNITAPHFRRHIQRVANPPGVTFYPSATAEAGVGRWQLEVAQDGKVWKTFAGVGSLPDSIAWDWRGDRRDLPQLPMRLSYRFEVVDSTGQIRSTEAREIAVNYRSVGQRLERRLNDTSIDTYSLLLFNYDSPKLSAGDQELIRAIAGDEGFSSSATVHFRGYTDSLGEAEHNRQLANTRAAEAAKLFGGVGSSRVDLQACKLEYSIVSPK